MGREQAFPDRNCAERSRDCSQCVTQAVSASVWVHTTSEGADWADCVRLPGNASSFLFLKAHNFQSDVPPDDFKRHFNQQLKPVSFYKHTLDQPNFTHSLTCSHVTGELARECHAASVRATGNVATPQGYNKDPGGQSPDTRACDH